MKFTLWCAQCGVFAHDIDAGMMAVLAAYHPTALLFPAEHYANAANDMFAEAEWCVTE